MNSYVGHHDGWRLCEKRYKWSKKGKKNLIRGELEGKGTEEKTREIADHSLVLNGIKLV